MATISKKHAKFRKIISAKHYNELLRQKALKKYVIELKAQNVSIQCLQNVNSNTSLRSYIAQTIDVNKSIAGAKYWHNTALKAQIHELKQQIKDLETLLK